MASRQQRQQAWNNTPRIPGKNPGQWRRDVAGNPIFRGAYGKNGPKSWEVDHKKPRSKGGSNNPRNLQAMQTSENRRKSDQYPYIPAPSARSFWPRIRSR